MHLRHDVNVTDKIQLRCIYRMREGKEVIVVDLHTTPKYWFGLCNLLDGGKDKIVRGIEEKNVQNAIRILVFCASANV